MGLGGCAPIITCVMCALVSQLVPIKVCLCCDCGFSVRFYYFECVCVCGVCMCMFVWHGVVRIRVSRRCCDTIWAEAHKPVATHHTPDVSRAHIHTHASTHGVSCYTFPGKKPKPDHTQISSVNTFPTQLVLFNTFLGVRPLLNTLTVLGQCFL